MKALKKYRLFKFTALLMAFVWLFGAYAAGMTGVHATDEFNYPGEDNNYIEGEYFGENDVATFNAVARSDWEPILERRDWQYSGNLSDPLRDPREVNFDTSVLEPGMTFSEIHYAIFHCQTRKDCDNNSTVFPACPEERFAAFRLWHFHSSAPIFHYLEMCRDELLRTLEDDHQNPARNWGVGNFQYAYVQMLHFNTNFELVGDHTPSAVGNWDSRMVIMGSYYDRMFVNTIRPAVPPAIDCYGHGYGTLRNYLFPMSPACAINPPVAGVQPGFTNLVHPDGMIFGGWFVEGPEGNPAYFANNLGSQEGRFFERTERVTTDLNKNLFARWYPLPTVEKAVSPGQLTHAQVAAGNPLFYTITIDTHGLPSNMIDLVVQDTLDDRLTLVESSVRIHPSVGSDPNYTNEDGALSFYISDIFGPVRAIERIEITFRATVNLDVITPEPTEIIRIPNTAILFGPPGPDSGEREKLGRDDTVFEIPLPPVPPAEYPPDPPDDPPPPPSSNNNVEPDTTDAAPRTGDFTATAPLLAGFLFSMSAVLGGISLRRRFRR